MQPSPQTTANKKVMRALDGDRMTNTTPTENQGAVCLNIEGTHFDGKAYAFELPNGKNLILNPMEGRPSPLGRVLVALVEAGNLGITNFQPYSLHTLEVRDYRYRLVHHYGVDIEGSWETHAGGRHRRWHLKSDVKILHQPQRGA